MHDKLLSSKRTNIFNQRDPKSAGNAGNFQGLGFLLAVFVAVGTRSEPMGEGQLRLEPRETFLGEKVLVLETQP